MYIIEYYLYEAVLEIIFKKLNSSRPLPKECLNVAFKKYIFWHSQIIKFKANKQTKIKTTKLIQHKNIF